jgi:hypothetical protein
MSNAKCLPDYSRRVKVSSSFDVMLDIETISYANTPGAETYF